MRDSQQMVRTDVLGAAAVTNGKPERVSSRFTMEGCPKVSAHLEGAGSGPSWHTTPRGLHPQVEHTEILTAHLRVCGASG